MHSAHHAIESKLTGIPDKPGVYQYYDNEGKLLYIGKAKLLKKRVASYFNKPTGQSGKTRLLVRKIADIKYIVVETEQDALFLENSLIKKHQPPYNIQLKDDKSYPWICIKNEPFPRVFYTRDIVKDGSQYFGPYGRVKVISVLLELISRLYKLRNCSYNLTDENIKKDKFKLCLEYQIGNCKGPCEGLQSHEDYQKSIDQIKHILKGNSQEVIQHLKQDMQHFAENFQFEKAHYVKTQLELLEKFQVKSTIVNPSIDNVEVYSLISNEKSAFVNFMRVHKGAIVQALTLEYKKKLDESDKEILELAITEFRERFPGNATEIYVPFEVELATQEVKQHIPERGDKKKLLGLSLHNAKQYLLEKQKSDERINPDKRIIRILSRIQTDLRLTELPRHIECFDNSNFQGTDAVAACVVFKNAKPAKKDYRHFNIKTVEGPDDFASMKEVVYRRYKRLLEEKQSLPQLIVIDGGKGQLSAAVESLEALELRGKIAIIGIAKRLEEIYFPSDPYPLYIDKKSESLKIIQYLRDEAHRFGITHHRNKRSKSSMKSELNGLDGVGKKTIEILLKQFKSVARIKKATPEELAAVIGEKNTQSLYKHLHTGE